MKNKTEARIQQEIFIWFNNKFCLKFHEPRHCIFSVPNDSESKEETMRKKATGLLSGVSDLIILLGDRTLFVEVKTATGTQSDAQKEFESRVTMLGYTYIVVRSLEDFQFKIESL